MKVNFFENQTLTIKTFGAGKLSICYIFHVKLSDWLRRISFPYRRTWGLLHSGTADSTNGSWTLREVRRKGQGLFCGWWRGGCSFYFWKLRVQIVGNLYSGVPFSPSHREGLFIKAHEVRAKRGTLSSFLHMTGNRWPLRHSFKKCFYILLRFTD